MTYWRICIVVKLTFVLESEKDIFYLIEYMKYEYIFYLIEYMKY